VHRPGAAEGVDHELLGQIAGAHHLAPDQVGHLAVDDVVNAGGGFVDFQLERPGDLLFDRARRLLFIQNFPAAEKIVGVDDAEDEIGIGDRDLPRRRRRSRPVGVAPRSSARRAAGPCQGRRAMVPPPAPIDSM
jgi:hypothetical protein